MSTKPSDPASDIAWGHEGGLGEPCRGKGDVFPGKALVLAQIWRKTSTLRTAGDNMKGNCVFQSLKGLPSGVNIFIWLLNEMVSILILFIVKTLLSCLISCFAPLKVWGIVDYLLHSNSCCVKSSVLKKESSVLFRFSNTIVNTGTQASGVGVLLCGDWGGRGWGAGGQAGSGHSCLEHPLLLLSPPEGPPNSSSRCPPCPPPTCQHWEHHFAFLLGVLIGGTDFKGTLPVHGLLLDVGT